MLKNTNTENTETKEVPIEMENKIENNETTQKQKKDGTHTLSKTDAILLKIMPVLIIFGIIASFLSGYWYKTIIFYEKETTDFEYAKYILDKEFINDDFDKNFAEYNAINAYLDTTGDKYAYYLSAEEYEKRVMSNNGENIVLGISFSVNDDLQMVINGFTNGTNAQTSGLKIGDVLVSIGEYKISNYNDYTNFSVSKVFKENEEVTVIISRDNEEKSFNIVAKKIITPLCESKFIDDIAYIKLTKFSDKSAEDFKIALNETVFKNEKCKGLIIDLRNNGGGDLKAMQSIAGNFLNNKLIANFKYKKSEEKIYPISADKIFEGKIAILVNENTASASECFSSALQYYDKATIVGTQTFGKGIGQTTYPCPNGGFVTFTTAKYFLPDDTSVHEVGVTPDKKIDLPDNIKNGSVVLNDENDVQLIEAKKLF